jgi:meiotically up-regulated gene 157 (Mug157) protein
MIKSGFRGSDDAVTLPYNIPENAFAVTALRATVPVLLAVNQSALAGTANQLANQVAAGIATYGVYTHPTLGTKVYAYEVDGFSNYYFMDDANIPGLLSMPYYGFVNATDPLYLATRAAVLSPANPYWLNGTAGSGVGGPHIGWPNIWPMSIMLQAWTSTNDTEIANCLSTLLAASACTGLNHESFDVNDAFSFTRPWFAWVNALFGDLILKIANERPYLIFN